MAIVKLNIEEFLQLGRQHPILDVRSPGEYIHAHIPGAYTLPLFSDEERKIVGTAYKQESREKAIKIGLDFFGVKMKKIVEEVEAILNNLPGSKNSHSKSLLIHCWRGGMRSSAIAWLMDLYGFKVYTLTGGYKKFRQYTIETFSLPFNFKIVGGFTGSGKTEILKKLDELKEPVIDLEAIALHRGSAFGTINVPQPSQEMFENTLALTLRRKLILENSLPEASCIWIEDESQRIGNINIPSALWKTMRQSYIFFLDIPFEERLAHIVKIYGKIKAEKLVAAIIRIQKRLGGLETKTAINFLLEDNPAACFNILLKYYDKWYMKGFNERENVRQLSTKIICPHVDTDTNLQKMITS